MYIAEVLDNLVITLERLLVQEGQRMELGVTGFGSGICIKPTQIDIGRKVQGHIVLVVPNFTDELGQGLVHLGRRGKGANRLEAFNAFFTPRGGLAKIKVVVAIGAAHETRLTMPLDHIEIRHILVESANSRTGCGERQQASQIPT